MEEVTEKFNNFKWFICSITPPEIQARLKFRLLMQGPMHLFLKSVYTHMVVEKESVDQVVAIVCDFAGVAPADFTEEQIEKFKLYIEYFGLVAAALGGVPAGDEAEEGAEAEQEEL